MKEKFAGVIRVSTAPPFLIMALILVLWNTTDIMRGAADGLSSLLLLGALPLLAYPAQRLIPKFREEGRAGQRKLAFLFTVVGYLGAWLYGVLSGAGAELMFVCNTYVFAVVILSVLNKVFRIRASGHACSTISPCVFCAYMVSLPAAIPFLILMAESIWASLYLKRHKPSDIVYGILSFTAAFLIALCLR